MAVPSLRSEEAPERVGVEVVKDLAQWFTELQATHTTCAWDFKPHKNFLATRKTRSFYLIAIQKGLGEAQCLQELNCDAGRIHPTIPVTCGAPGVWQG